MSASDAAWSLFHHDENVFPKLAVASDTDFPLKNAIGKCFQTEGVCFLTADDNPLEIVSLVATNVSLLGLFGFSASSSVVFARFFSIALMPLLFSRPEDSPLQSNAASNTSANQTKSLKQNRRKKLEYCQFS